MWTKRQIDLLALISQHIEGISGNQIATSLAISDRLVRYEIQSMNQTLKAFNVMIRAKQPNGYFIEGKDYDQIQSILNDGHIKQPPDYELMILGYILFHPNTHLDELVTLTHYSESTVLKYLTSLQKSYAASLFVIESQTIRITQNEQVIRQVVDQVIKRRVFKQMMHNDYSLFVDVFDEMDYQSIEQSLMDCIHYFQLEYSHLTFHYLLWILYFFICRNKHGFVLTTLTDIQPYNSLNLVTKWINQSHELLSSLDNQLLNDLFKDIKSVTQSRQRVTQLIYDLFKKQLVEQFHIDLDTQPTLSSKLLNHLYGLHQRLDLQLQAETTYAPQIKKRYPYAYFIASMINPYFLQLTSKLVAFEEIAMLALYIEQVLSKYQQLNVVLIQHNALALTESMIQFIDTHFNQRLHQVKIIPAYQVSTLNDEHIDFIISCTPVETTLPVCIIRPLPTDGDRKRIFNVIHQIHHQSNYISMVHDLFSEQTCFKKNPSSIEDLLTSPVYGLNFSQRQIEKEKILASMFSDWMLVVEQSGEQDNVTMILLDQPLNFHPVQIKLVFVVTTTSKYNKNLALLYEFLKSMSKQKHLLHRFKHVKKSEDFVHELLYFASSIN